MKRLLALLSVLILLCVAGISTGVSANDSVTVKVGIYENKPKIFTDEQGNAAGFWPEIISYIASKEGWKIEYVHGTWAQCLQRLENNEIDMMPDVAYTEERDRLYDFSQETVYASWSRVYTKAGSDIQSILDLAGKNIAVMEGSVNVEGPDGIKKLAEAFCVDCTFIPVDSYVKVFELVDKGEADAGVVSKDFAYQHQSKYNVIETPIIFQPVHLYFAFPSDSTLKPYLIEKIDNDVKKLKEVGDSIYYQSLKRWFGTEPITQPIMPDWSVWLLIGFGILAVAFGGGTLIFRTQVNKRTRELAEDIDKRKRIEQELRLVLETMPLGLVVLDLEGKITQVNRTALQMGSYNSNDLIGKNYLDFIVKRDHDKARTNLKNTLEIGFFASTEYALIKNSGEEFPARISIGLLKDHSGNPAGFIASIEDVTVQKQAEEEHKKISEYREQEKLRTQLLSTVSHELRTPLADIKGYTTMLLQYYNKMKKTQKWESLEAIDQSTDRLEKLIEHLLDMSRLETGLLKLDLQPVQPRNILQQAIEEAKLKSPKHKFQTFIKKQLPVLTADAKRLKQVIDNLLDNAVKYSPEGTEITLRAEENGKELLVSVADQGKGIPASELDKIFDRFYHLEQRLEKDPGGLGIGLSLCNALVEAHGGSIWAESQVDKGSTFYFTIPLKKSTG